MAKHFVVVGGGAAGFMAAIEAARTVGRNRPLRITILEATSRVLKKVSISGGGRCNLMHDPSKHTSEILAGYPRGMFIAVVLS